MRDSLVGLILGLAFGWVINILTRKSIRTAATLWRALAIAALFAALFVSDWLSDEVLDIPPAEVTRFHIPYVIGLASTVLPALTELKHKKRPPK